MRKREIISLLALFLNNILFVGVAIFLVIFLYSQKIDSQGEVVLEEFNFSDGIAPNYISQISDENYFTNNAVISVYSIEPLEFDDFEGEVIEFPVEDKIGYYYELVKNIPNYGVYEIELIASDQVENVSSMNFIVDRIALFDQTIKLDYIPNKDDSKVITDIKIDSILEPNLRLPASYKPNDLVRISTIVPSIDTLYLREEAANALFEMYKDMSIEGIEVFVTSAYRTFQAQTYTYNYISTIEGSTVAERKAAIPGYSEHQLGLALDMVNAETNYVLPVPGVTTRLYTWLEKNASKYGFYKTYDGSDETIGEEIWHWRYTGKKDLSNK